MEEKWIYTGVFLDDSSKKKLIKKFIIPEGWTKVFDHMTVIYNDGSEYVKSVKTITDIKVGQKIKLKVIAQGISDKAYALKVQIPSGLPTTQNITHITLATSPSGKPVDSNYIENWNPIYDNLFVTGILNNYVVYESKK